jgi:hypothetical protein
VQGEAIWLDDLPVAVVATTPVIYYVHTDQLQRQVAMTNARQSLAWSAAYTPFGAAQTITTPGKAGQAGLTSFPRLAQSAGEILGIFPGRPARTRASRGGSASRSTAARSRIN